MLVRYRDWSWIVALFGSWASLAIAWQLLQQVIATGTISYHMGNWAPPLGIEYRIDLVNAFVLLIVSAIGAVVTPYARESLRTEFGSNRIYMFYTAYMLCLCGLLGERRSKLVASGFKNKKGEPLAHQILYQQLFNLCDQYCIDLQKVKGHQPKREKRTTVEKIFGYVDCLSRKKLRSM